MAVLGSILALISLINMPATTLRTLKNFHAVKSTRIMRTSAERHENIETHDTRFSTYEAQ